MNFRKLTTAAVLAGAMVVAGTGVGQADPAKPASDVHYNAKVVDKTVVLTLDRGSAGVVKNDKVVYGEPARAKFEAKQGQAPVKVQKPGTTVVSDVVALKNDKGAVVEKLPLQYRFNNVFFPIKQEISADRRTVTLTPQMDPVSARLISSGQPAKPMPQAKAIASPEEDRLAQANFMNQLGVATTVGSLVGTAIGAVVGGIAGAVIALASCAAFLACLIIGLPIFATFAGAGGIAGTIIAGGGALVAAGQDYVQTMQAPAGTTHYQAEIDRSKMPARPAPRR
ncbi:MAG: hypothetical protein HOQ24_11070 [Mycobacteriaceae bacterium]|nr:hypothetical protein [Mycobacteriaceae bacterium]